MAGPGQDRQAQRNTTQYQRDGHEGKEDSLPDHACASGLVSGTVMLCDKGVHVLGCSQKKRTEREICDPTGNRGSNRGLAVPGEEHSVYKEGHAERRG